MVTAIMIGAGQRGHQVYGACALDHPDKIKIVAVCEPNKERREIFAKAHGLGADRCFASWEEVIAGPKIADAAIICTQDRQHTQAALAALEKGYHVLVEKPMSPLAEECIAMGEAAKKYDRIFDVCHVLRYSEFFTAIKKVVDAGTLGKIINIKHAEDVGFWHMPHSFVRGNWRNKEETSPMILAKCCHDMDIILWLMGQPCVKVSSMGSLTYFLPENAPAGAPLRCTDGCPSAERCIYNAERFYLGDNTAWPVSAICDDMSLEARREALKTGPYGRCVFHCDNDVVDHQNCLLEFADGATATLTMVAFTAKCTRKIEIMGTKGMLTGEMSQSGAEGTGHGLKIFDFLTGEETVIPVKDDGYASGHEGADVSLLMDFIDQVEHPENKARTSADVSVESHLMALAAEKARVEDRVVYMSEMR